MSKAVKEVRLACEDLVGIRSELAQIRTIDGRRGFSNEELAEARSFLVEKGVISDEVRAVTAGSVKRFMSRLDVVRSEIPGSCGSFTKSIRITISQSSRRFAMRGYEFEPAGVAGRLGEDELYIIGAASMATGVDDLFGFDRPEQASDDESAHGPRQINSTIVMNEEFPSEREEELWEMVDAAYGALARGDLDGALDILAGMGIAMGQLQDLWDRHPGLALDHRKISIAAADLLHAAGEEGRAFDVLAGSVAVPYGSVSLVYDYEFSRGFGYPSPGSTSSECSYRNEDRSWAEDTFWKLTDQLAGKINCFEAARPEGE